MSLWIYPAGVVDSQDVVAHITTVMIFIMIMIMIMMNVNFPQGGMADSKDKPPATGIAITW